MQQINLNIVAKVALISFMLSACTHEQTFVVKDGDGGSTSTAKISSDGKDASVEIKDHEGNTAANMTMGNSAKYPPEFPVGQYPGSNVKMVLDQSGMAAGAQIMNVSLETNDSADSIQSYYRNWFNSNGWKITSDTNTSGIVSITAEQGNRNFSLLTIAGDGGKTTIQLTLSSTK